MNLIFSQVSTANKWEEVQRSSKSCPNARQTFWAFFQKLVKISKVSYEDLMMFQSESNLLIIN